MKRLTLLIIFFCPLISLKAQDILQTISKDVCDCMEKSIPENPEKNATDMMEICLMPTFLENEEKLRKIYGDAFFEDPNNARNMGIEIGKILVKDCEVFLNYFVEQEKQEIQISEQSFEKGELAKENGNYEEALEHYNNAVALELDNDDYVNSRGTLHYETGDYYKAISDFMRAIELDEDVAVYYYNLANTLYELNELEEGLKYLETSLAKDDTNCDGFNLKGLIYESYNLSDSSILYFEKGYRCAPNDAIIAYNAGYAYYNNRQFSEALGWFFKADSLGYTGSGINSYIGNCFYSQQKYRESIQYHELHYKSDTSNYIPVYNIGTCYYNLGDYDNAAKYLKLAYSLEEEDADIPMYLSRTYSGKRDNLTAKAFIDKAIQLNPSNAELYDERARIYVFLEDYEKAITDYTISLALYPDDCKVYELMGETYKKTGKIREADEAFAKAVELGCK